MDLLEAASTAIAPQTFKERSFFPELGFEDVDPDSHLFRSLTQSSRDLPQYKHDRVQSIAAWLYLSNPLAYRITEQTKDFTIGKGISYEAEDERVKAVLDGHWENPVNKWELKQHSRILELGLFGELFNPVFINDKNGDVTVGCVDPQNVKVVVTDPENIEVPTNIAMKGKGGRKGFVFDVVRHNDAEVLEGNIIISQLKRLSNMTRGVPDMTAIVDWLDKFDDIMFGELERLRLQRAWVEDITVEGAQENDILKYRKEWAQTPKWGSRWIHNEKVSREFLSPQIHAADLEKFLKLILGIILAGAGIPEHFMLMAQDLNRATAQVMDPPMMRRIETRQRFVRGYFRSLFDFVITQAAIHNKQTEAGGLKESDLNDKNILNYQIIFPDPSQKDIKDTAQAIVQLTNALVVAETQGWVSGDKAREIFSVLAQEFGVEIDADEEKEKAEQQLITESIGAYAYAELRDFIDWFQESNGDGQGLREKVRLAVIEEGLHRKKKKEKGEIVS